MATIIPIKDGLSFQSGNIKGEMDFYVKQLPEMLDDTEYGCCFLTSQYFTAESDFFKVNIKIEDGRKEVFGWLFPINLLSEDAAFYEGMDEHLLGYLHVGLHKLIDYSIDNNLFRYDSGTPSDLGLSEDLILLVYRHSICDADGIANLYPSLYDKGFIVTDEPDKVSNRRLRKNIYQRDRINDFKSDPHRNCITLSKVAPVFRDNRFVSSLFKSYLPTIDDAFFRYLMLYQIIEFLMSVEYSNRYFDFVEKYGNDKRHNLMEKFGELSSEAKLIGKVYEIGAIDSFHQDFSSSAQQLLDKIGEGGFKDAPSFQDYMYKIRNMVVHSLSVMKDYPEDMQRLADIYEIVIIDLIHRAATEIKKDKKLFVIDLNKPYEEVNGLLYGAYHA